MNKQAIFHQPQSAMAYPIRPEVLHLVLKTARADVDQVTVIYDDRYASLGSEDFKLLERTCHDEMFDYWETDIEVQQRRFRYAFYLESASESVWYGEEGVSSGKPGLAQGGFFQYPYVFPTMAGSPAWADEAVVYQIFPERFANGDRSNDPETVQSWDSVPTSRCFFGGDLQGIIDRLEYVTELGVNCLYLTPIFESPSNHKYNTTDYYQVDRHFGDLETARKMVTLCHLRGIRVVLDAVFNHSGDGFFAFADVKEKGEESEYRDWFNLSGYPVQINSNPNYETFANRAASMPKLMTDNSAVAEYFLEVVEHWTRELGIDGWRLDVANEVSHDFWREMRRRVRAINPDILIVGEIWHESTKWLEGDQFDSVMNYPFRNACLDFFAHGRIGADQFLERMNRLRYRYRLDTNRVLWNLLDSHDTERFVTSCGEKKERLLLAVAFQMTYLGVPMIYYGDEVGMTGLNDPDCRRGMVWDKEKQDQGILEAYKELIEIRKTNYDLFVSGRVIPVLADPTRNVVAFARCGGHRCAVTILNNSNRRVTVDLGGLRADIPNIMGATRFCSLLSRESVPPKVTLEPMGYEIVEIK